MEKIIYYQVNKDRAALAVYEGRLVEVYIEESKTSPLVGRIYRGKVVNVLPGMQAAFVNIGLEKNAFLYVDDALPTSTDNENKKPCITKVVAPGQELLVQILKEPGGAKGARITTHITLPGRYLVYMPTMEHIGISRKIEDVRERDRLRELGEKLKPPMAGIIIRTVAEGKRNAELSWDIEMLEELWDKINSDYKKARAPELIHSDMEIEERIVRDFLSEDVQSLITNNKKSYEKLQQRANSIQQGLDKVIKLEECEDIFSKNNVYKDLEVALQSKVWLKSGGYLVFDQTEAMLVIDVNTGKYVGSTTLEETIFHINMEAVDEIARQIRLRNAGGIIVIDFIDMESEFKRQLVLERLTEAVKRDQMKITIVGQTPLGLVELTRKKVRPSLESALTHQCPRCRGAGRLIVMPVDKK
ncbi:ribonuclease G [Desulfitispora alkaliphila]|uniref:Rne/Rng family ribonuclease n=1 Tax=Desulfitispora alkaliphila TaxID=622674 RepID=UPI003D202268